MKGYLLYACLIATIVFLCADTYLRLTGRYNTYAESIGRKYTSYYNAVCPTWYIVRWANDTSNSENSDFHYSCVTNKLGLREKDFGKSKPDSAIRIFVTGDSFSEGEGAPYDSTWAHLLNSYLNKDGIKAEVLNTGVAGSDPVYNYVLHRDILKGYKADYIIVSVNSSDFTDYMLRGGFERFYTDGTTHYKKGPWYEPIYKYSFLARGIIERVGRFPFRGIFSNEEEFSVSADKAIACYRSVVDSFINLTKADSTRIIVLLYATPAEIRFDNKEGKRFHQAFIDLQQQLTEKNIPCINIWDGLKAQLVNKNYLQYTYPNDPHYNPFGYNLMAQLVEKQLLQQQLLKH